jgi:peptide deformylase
MAILTILTYPDRFLRTQTQPVTVFDQQLERLIDDMAETMYHAPGVGLAATQVGVDKSVIVYDGFPGEEREELRVLINPKIVRQEGEVLSENEGCLSVPDFRADVKRAAAVTIEGLDRNGNPVVLELDNYLGTVLQHEIDHLNGVLFIDRISKLKKNMYKRRMKKKRAEN